MSDQTTTTEREEKKSWWTRQDSVTKWLIGVLLTCLGIAIAVPTALLNSSKLVEGPSLEVTAISGPYNPLPDPKSGPWPVTQHDDHFKWYSEVHIANNGNLPAENVAINWKGSGEAFFTDDNRATLPKTFTDKLELGTLPNQSDFQLKMWTEKEFSLQSEVAPKVSYKGGQIAIFASESSWYRVLFYVTLLLLLVAISLMAFGYFMLKYVLFHFVFPFTIRSMDEIDKKLAELSDLTPKARKLVLMEMLTHNVADQLGDGVKKENWKEQMTAAIALDELVKRGGTPPESSLEKILSTRQDSSLDNDTENKEPSTTDASKTQPSPHDA